MEHLYDDIQHFGTILAGIEPINLKLKDGTDLDYAGRYAQSVLRLHAQDELGAFAGNESLLDGIKKGAKNTKDWIMKFLSAVKDFITNVYSKVRTKVKIALQGGRQGVAMNAAKTVFGSLDTHSKQLREAASRYEKALEKTRHLDTVKKLSEEMDSLSTMLDRGNKEDAGKFHTGIGEVMDKLSKLSTQINADINLAAVKIPKDLSANDYDEKSKYASDLGMAGVTIANALAAVTKSCGKWMSKINELADIKDEDTK